ncbi:unnamed protein product, partial [Phaeothamnion confervicola]
MPITALNVAEKPSVARELSNILGQGRARARPGRTNYNRIFEFECNVMGQQVNMILTSVTGHLKELEFAEPYGKKWHACAPLELFDAPVVKYVKEENKKLQEQLEAEARKADWLILWLDCDREGENIAFEVIEVCKRVRPRLRLYRSRFSALIPQEINRSVQNLVEPNKAAADAVDARQEIDLRLGAAFTRFQTLRLQARFDELQNGVISYGPCQFPTLGFIVERHKHIENFVREPFWSIKLEYTPTAEDEDNGDEEGGGGSGRGNRGGNAGSRRLRTSFLWKRERLFDHLACLVLFEMTVDDGVAVVTSVDGRRTTRQRLLPLSTVELQKRASRFFRLASERTMDVAEKLYQKGFLSYPRTETDKFSKNFDIQAALNEFRPSATFGGYVAGLLDRGAFQWPREGRHDDQAHPPIHPTKAAEPGSFGSNEER